MNATPDYLDPARRAAVRNLLRQTVDESVAAAPTVRRRRVVRFVSIATAAVLVVGGAGVAFATLRPAASPGGTAVAPPATSEPAAPATSAAPVAPPPTASLPAGVDPAGTPTATAVPTPTPFSQSETASWVVSFDGIGPLGMGDSQKADAALMTEWRTLESPVCQVLFFQDDGFGPNLATSSTAQAPDVTNYVRVGDGFAPSEDTQDLAALSPRTSSGIRLGSTLAQLQVAYPAAVHAGDAPGAGAASLDYWSVSNGAGRWMDFGMATDGGVATITVTTTSIPPDEEKSCGQDG